MNTKWNHSVIVLLPALVLLGASGPAKASDLEVLFFDDFDDGDWDGWIVQHPADGGATSPPDIVPSPEGYSIRGVGSGYYQPGLSTHIVHPVSISNVEELTIEMRAKSGPSWPNEAAVAIRGGQDYYRLVDYGELGENEVAELRAGAGGTHYVYRYPIGSLAFEWHDFKLTRDAAGVWALTIDDGLVDVPSFGWAPEVVDFDRVSIEPLRNQSEVEWIRISGVPEPSLPGDLNGDGFVGYSDLGIVLDFWGQTVTAGVQADPTGDGFVGQFDLDLVLGHWGEGTLPTSPVPEPATLSLFALASLAVMRRPVGRARVHLGGTSA